MTYLRDALTERVGEFIQLRRDIHRHPELAFEEHRTSDLVAAKLQSWGYQVHRGLGGTGVVGTLKRGSSERKLGIRADMDALPIQEATGAEWASTRQGLMHTCGHDGHTAMLLAAAKAIAQAPDFDGTLNLIFQPAEEGGGGALKMMEDGLFDRFPVQSIYAMHNWPAMKPGTVGINAGPMMAAADRFTIEITGRGGHGAHAYQTVDVLVVAAHIITAAQSIVSRNVRPIESAVVSICAAQAGDLGAFSVLPGSATLVGTVRTFDPVVQEMVEKRLKELCNAIALGFGATATVHYERIYPATINSESEAIFAGDVAESLLGADHVVRDLEPSMGAEDFAFMLQTRPGAYLRIGQGTGASGSALHNSRYDFNDDILPLGSALHASLIEQAMPLAAA